MPSLGMSWQSLGAVVLLLGATRQAPAMYVWPGLTTQEARKYPLSIATSLGSLSPLKANQLRANSQPGHAKTRQDVLA